MGLFEGFEYYKYSLDGITTNVTNIGISLVVDKVRNVDNRFAFQNYMILENEIPESVSEKKYGDVKYYWTILLINNIINPFDEWPMSSDDLIEYIKYKYSSLGGLYGTHHYVNIADNSLVDDYNTNKYNLGEIVPDTVKIITNFEHEYTLNESKRHIKIINPVFIKEFTYSYDKALNSKMSSTLPEEGD